MESCESVNTADTSDQAHVLSCIGVIQENITHIMSCKNFPCDQCLEAVDKCNEAYSENHEVGETIADEIIAKTDYFAMFKEKWSSPRWHISEENDEALAADSQHYNFFSKLTSLSWRLGDDSAAFSEALDEEGCLPVAIKWVTSQYDKNNSNDWVSSITFNVLNMLYTCVRNVPSLRAKYLETLPMLQGFGESGNDDMKTLVCLLSAYLVTKDDADKQQTDKRSVLSLIKKLGKSVVKYDRKGKGKEKAGSSHFSDAELIQGISQLAINDENKKMIVDNGGISIVGSVLVDSNSSVEEQIQATKALWQLGFLDSNKDQLKKANDVIKGLTRNINSKVDSLRNASIGALFEINGHRLPDAVRTGDEQAEGLSGSRYGEPVCAVEEQNEGSTESTSRESVCTGDERQEGSSGGGSGETVRTGDEQEEDLSESRSGESGHIMISYRWEKPSKPVMREMKEQLMKRGFTVWMDEDKMSGDIIGAMAEAVEKADVVMACISQGYQESLNCRSELSYANVLRKKIVPIKVDPQFEPSGWLGLIAAGKLYYTVKRPEKVSEVLPEIVDKELKGAFRSRDKITAAVADPSSSDLLSKGTDAVHSLFKKAGKLYHKVNRHDEVSEGLPEIVEKVMEGVDGSRDGHHASAAAMSGTPSPQVIASWSRDAVRDWLKKNGVNTRGNKLEKLDGTHLLGLQDQLASAPEAFYRSVEKDLKVKYIDVLTLVTALKTLRSDIVSQEQERVDGQTAAQTTLPN